MVDRDRTVSRRSKPSSCTTLIGEQPNPWNRLQLQDVISRHRGAKQLRRFGLWGVISLLSPAYLLFVDRYPFHTVISGHYDRRLLKINIPARLVSLTVKQAFAIALFKKLKNLFELVFVRPRYSLGGDRPSQTTRQTLFHIRFSN